MTTLAHTDLFRPRLRLRRNVGTLFSFACLLLTLTGFLVLIILLGRIVQDGWNYVDFQFLNSFPNTRQPEESGVKDALFGTIWLIGLTALMSIPVGVGAAIYLNEYASKNRLTRFIELNIANLAGVPSIVYGMLGLAIFVRWILQSESVLAGAMTMSLLILPVIIIAAKESLGAVPNSIRHAAYSLGATRWQVVRSHVLPAALPSICTGVILSLSRAIGETAPLIMVGAFTSGGFIPEGPMDDFTALPIQIYNWTKQPDPVFHQLAASGIMVLLAALLLMNAVAIGIRHHYQRTKIH